MKKILASSAILLTPVFAMAQGVDTGYFEALVSGISRIIDDFLIPIVIALAVLVFLWGVFKAFILGGSDEGKRKEGRQLMLWGIIAFVIMGALWGIVNLTAAIFGIDTNEQSIERPQTPNIP